MTGRVVDSLAVSERFLWDLRKTIAELNEENYAGRLRELAHKHGMRLSIEAYGDGLFDNLSYAGWADSPMCEFWVGRWGKETAKEMASAGHTYGRNIVGAESFTAVTAVAKWMNHPFSIKALGDEAFCNGVNRFVFHRYAMQPWLNRVPGMTMGPWGIHYERTETWWEQTRPWHEYLARCNHLLRQGLFVADLCYLQTEGSPSSMTFAPPTAYDFDGCTPEVVLTRMSVRDGRLVLPDGMSYRLLVAAAERDDDARAAGPDQGTGRGRGDGGRAAAAKVAQSQRLPAVRRAGARTCRGTVGQLRRQKRHRARLR